MRKKKFSLIEKYAIWKCHGERCWLCREPLQFRNSSVDHIIPEWLLDDDAKREEVLSFYGLTDDNFNINGFENWLPSHLVCNQQKGSKPLRFTPSLQVILDKTIKKSDFVKQFVDKWSRNKNKDKILFPLLSALDTGVIEQDEIIEFLKPLGEKAGIQIIPKDLILLDSGYWVHRNDIAKEGFCSCEREACVGSNEKIYCYFPPTLPEWVISAGLYMKCYDEIVICPRCEKSHKRGHIGKLGSCSVPFKNQDMRQD